jgi:hypothetical protein
MKMDGRFARLVESAYLPAFGGETAPPAVEDKQRKW